MPDERSTEDRAIAIVKRRAEVRAQQLGVSTDYLWNDRGYKNLVPFVWAMLSPDGGCPGCRHVVDRDSDIHIAHIERPRYVGVGAIDTAREHARNLIVLCHECVATMKSHTSFSEWLDEQWRSRVTPLVN